jgi:hypothetical protein
MLEPPEVLTCTRSGFLPAFTVEPPDSSPVMLRAAAGLHVELLRVHARDLDLTASAGLQRNGVRLGGLRLDVRAATGRHALHARAGDVQAHVLEAPGEEPRPLHLRLEHAVLHHQLHLRHVLGLALQAHRLRTRLHLGADAVAHRHAVEVRDVHLTRAGGGVLRERGSGDQQGNRKNQGAELHGGHTSGAGRHEASVLQGTQGLRSDCAQAARPLTSPGTCGWR